MLFYLLNRHAPNIPDIETILNKPEVSIIITCILIAYITYSSVSPNKHAVRLVGNDLGRIAILLLIVYLSMIRLDLGILVTFAFLVTMYNDKNLDDSE